MPRPREFDPDQALENAMRVFWEKGYEAASIRDLVNATGVNRASLYATFGGKRRLFEAALARFRGGGHSLQALAADAPPGLARIRAVFRHAAARSLHDDRGCLLLNSAAELSAVDPGVAACARQARLDMEEFFLRCLRDARAAAEIPPRRDLRALARYLTNSLLGLRMVAKMQPGPGLVSDIVATTLQFLSSIPNPSRSETI